MRHLLTLSRVRASLNVHQCIRPSVNVHYATSLHTTSNSSIPRKGVVSVSDRAHTREETAAANAAAAANAHARGVGGNQGARSAAEDADWTTRTENDLNARTRAQFEESSAMMGTRTYASTVADNNGTRLAAAPLLIRSCNASSFLIDNQLYVGPVFLINGVVLAWDVPQYALGSCPDIADIQKAVHLARDAAADKAAGRPIRHPVDPNRVNDPDSIFAGWTTDMLAPLELIVPRVEILVVGTGSKTQPFPSLLTDYCKQLGIQIEVQNTRSAAATFNFLAGEERPVACALLPTIPTSARTGVPFVDVIAT